MIRLEQKMILKHTRVSVKIMTMAYIMSTQCSFDSNWKKKHDYCRSKDSMKDFCKDLRRTCSENNLFWKIKNVTIDRKREQILLWTKKLLYM